MPSSVHETEPPTMPVPGDAACAVARMTAATDDSTGELHTEDDTEPDGTLKRTAEDSTTVVGGTGDAEGLTDDEADADALVDCDTLVDAETEDEDEIDTDAADEEETEDEDVCEGDTLLLNDTLGDDVLL